MCTEKEMHIFHPIGLQLIDRQIDGVNLLLDLSFPKATQVIVYMQHTHLYLNITNIHI